MTFLQSGQAANDAQFRCRVQACIFKIAQDVLNEDPETDGHPARVSLASNVVQDPSSHVNVFAWLCASNPTIAASVTETPLTDGSGEVVDLRIEVGASDSDLEFVCAGHWNTVVGWRGNRF